MMKRNLVQEYISVRAAVEREREGILARLREIEDALGRTANGLPTSGRRGRRGNPMPLRDAILRVTSQRPLTKEEIVEAVKRLGYRFTSKNPSNVVGVLVYGTNPAFRNEGGRFSPIAGTKVPPKGRTMSAAGRARVAAAQRARWAKVRKGTG